MQTKLALLLLLISFSLNAQKNQGRIVYEEIMNLQIELPGAHFGHLFEG